MHSPLQSAASACARLLLLDAPPAPPRRWIQVHHYRRELRGLPASRGRSAADVPGTDYTSSVPQYSKVAIMGVGSWADRTSSGLLVCLRHAAAGRRHRRRRCCAPPPRAVWHASASFTFFMILASSRSPTPCSIGEQLAMRTTGPIFHSTLDCPCCSWLQSNNCIRLHH